MISAIRLFSQPRHTGLHQRAKNLTSATALATGILCLGLGYPLLAEEATMSTSSGDNVSAKTDAAVSGTAAGGCKVSASASASSTTTNGQTVSQESHKSVSGPCGRANANAKATSTGDSGEGNGRSE
jgi:hypothetical protein